jgi:hypothetical protein
VDDVVWKLKSLSQVQLWRREHNAELSKKLLTITLVCGDDKNIF